MSLNLDDIKYYTIVCEHLNITRASEVIGISQPALSYSMKRLENEFGSQLIIRLKNGIQLTKTGEEFFKRAKKLILQWEDARNIFSDELEETVGEFSIGVHPSVAIYTLDKFLPVVQELYPKLNYRLIHGSSREICNKVINWEVDFAFVINPIQHPDLVIKELGKDHVTIFAAPDAVNKLIYNPDMSQSSYILGKLSESKMLYDGHVHSESLEVLAKLASCGVGHAILPTRVAQEYENLKAIKGAPRFIDKVCLVYRYDKHNNELSKKILDIIRRLKI